MWMSADPTAAAAAVWANRTKPLFSNRLMDALREKGAVTSFVDVVDITAAKEKEPEPEPQCSLEEEMQSLRGRLKEARDEIRASTEEALGCKNDLRDMRRKGHKQLTRKSSLETPNSNGGRWTNRPAAVSNFAGRHASTSSTGSDSLDDEYGYGEDDSQSDAELQAELEQYNSNGGDRRGSGSVLMLSGSQDLWALSGKSIAGRRRRRHMVENGGGGAGGGGGRNVGGYLHLRNMSSNNTDENDAAGEYIFDGSNTTGGGSSGDRESRLGLMRVSLKSVGVGGGSAADLFAKSTRNSPMSRMAGHGAMPSSPKHRRRKKKGGKGGGGGGGGSSSAGNSPKGSPKQRRKQKRTNADGSPRKRGGKKGVGVNTSRSVPISTLAHTSFSMSAPKLPSASSHVKSYSAPSSPRVSRRGATQAPSPSQIADAIAAKKQFQKPSNLMMQSPSHSRNGSLLSLAPKLSALMQTGLRQSTAASTAAFSG